MDRRSGMRCLPMERISLDTHTHTFTTCMILFLVPLPRRPSASAPPRNLQRYCLDYKRHTFTDSIHPFQPDVSPTTALSMRLLTLVYAKVKVASNPMSIKPNEHQTQCTVTLTPPPPFFQSSLPLPRCPSACVPSRTWPCRSQP